MHSAATLLLKVMTLTFEKSILLASVVHDASGEVITQPVYNHFCLLFINISRMVLVSNSDKSIFSKLVWFSDFSKNR